TSVASYTIGALRFHSQGARLHMQMRTHIAALMLVLFATGTSLSQNTPAPAASAAPIVGEWEGTLDTGHAKMQVLLHVNRRSSGRQLGGVADSVTENEFGLPISVIRYQKPAVHFELLDGAYDGTLSSDGNSIAGAWKQRGDNFTLNLHRITAQRAAQVAATA